MWGGGGGGGGGRGKGGVAAGGWHDTKHQPASSSSAQTYLICVRSPAGDVDQVREMTEHPAADAAAAYVQCMRQIDCAIEGPMAEHLQKDMAARRQADRSIGGQHFHIWLSVCPSNYWGTLTFDTTTEGCSC